MPNRIAVLSESLINRIAAGECVERPAAAAKELVENALDAGARRIEVELSAGGRKLLRVTDDGEGIAREDLPLAPLRHTTSKLHDLAGLDRIATLGFRGEALAALGEVSRMTITSRVPGAAEAWQISVEGGRLSEVAPAAGAPGTTVEVRELFYNAPARRKFLRGEPAERLAVVRAVSRLALSHPEVAFRLGEDGRELLSAPPAATLRERVAALYGAELAAALRETTAGEPRRLALHALLGPPSAHRADRSLIQLWLNGRPFRDAALLAAIGHGYGSLLPPRRFPVAFVRLELDPAEVDVNVHPTKEQVRFRAPGAVWALLSTAVREALAGADLAPRLAAGREVHGPTAPPSASGLKPQASSPAPAEFDLWFGERFGASLSPRGEGQGEGGPRGAEPPAAETSGRLGTGWRLLGQLHRSYLVVETAEGLRVVDQHALHERLLYEDILSRRRRLLGASQPLLLPETLELSAEEALALAAATPALAECGFEVAEFGPRTALLRAAPQLLAGRSAAAAVREILSGLLAETDGAGLARLGEERLRERLAARLACRAAVKAGEELARPQMEALLDGLAESGRADACAHGRPTSLVLSLAELERRLGRE